MCQDEVRSSAKWFICNALGSCSLPLTAISLPWGQGNVERRSGLMGNKGWVEVAAFGAQYSVGQIFLGVSALSCRPQTAAKVQNYSCWHGPGALGVYQGCFSCKVNFTKTRRQTGVCWEWQFSVHFNFLLLEVLSVSTCLSVCLLAGLCVPLAGLWAPFGHVCYFVYCFPLASVI